MTLDELIDRYCDAWSEADPARRAALLESVWAPSATYTDPTVADLGKVELLAHIAKVQATRPGARVRRTTVIDEHHGALRFGFTVVGADGAILRHGTDFAVLDSQRGRIRQIIGFFGALAASRDGA
jgi:hypothetical protein